MIDLVAMYEKGAITADHMIVACLERLDPTDPASMLSQLSPEMLDRMLRYANFFQHGTMISNYGAPPSMDRVAAAKKWIEAYALNGQGSADAKTKSKCADSLPEVGFTEAES
jgi:hypothetical protein